MEITVFAKKAKSREGREFYRFLSTLVNKSTGEEVTCSVKFAGDTSLDPKKCPCIITADKKDCNMAKKHVRDAESGDSVTYYTLWIKKWSQSDKEYIDHSLDDFE